MFFFDFIEFLYNSFFHKKLCSYKKFSFWQFPKIQHSASHINNLKVFLFAVKM